ncbi:MAG: hypothetical protein WKF84_12375 [Pyrinomonadaceae bacterium]
MHITTFVFGFLVLMGADASAASNTQNSQGDDGKARTTSYGRQLSSRDPAARQLAAEEIARVVAVDQRKDH